MINLHGPSELLFDAIISALSSFDRGHDQVYVARAMRLATPSEKTIRRRFGGLRAAVRLGVCVGNWPPA